MVKKITIDGYSACGKSYVSNMIVLAYNFAHIDSGLLFRLIAFLQLLNDTEEFKYEDFNYFDFFELDGNLIDNLNFRQSNLKSENIGLRASKLGEIKFAQEQLIRIQRKTVDEIEESRSSEGIVLSGRNCGTAVLPNADLKFFFTAPFEIRVSRRFNELQKLGVKTTKELIASQIDKRDRRDSKRVFGKLQIPNDSIIIDTSKYSKDELFNSIKNQISHLFSD